MNPVSDSVAQDDSPKESGQEAKVWMFCCSVFILFIYICTFVTVHSNYVTSVLVIVQLNYWKKL